MLSAPIEIAPAVADAPCTRTGARVIEITRQPDQCSFEELVRSVYIASCREPITLILKGVTAAEIDRVLDPIVPLLPVEIPGLRYVAPTQDDDGERTLRARMDPMFPYGSPDAASALIETGWRTSFNAASLVLDCFARPPRDARVRPSRLRELIAEWNARGHHPCKRQLVRCATAILENSRLSLRESIAVIGNLTLNAPSTAALSIAHAASGLGSLG